MATKKHSSIGINPRPIKVRGPRSKDIGDGATFARQYLYSLRADPKSVDLAGYIDDIMRAPIEQQEAFAGVLQGVLSKAIGRAGVSHG